MAELAAEHAVKTFGEDWEDNVKMDVSMGGLRTAIEFNGWAMRWWKSGAGDKERFAIATTKKDRNENFSPTIPAIVEYDYDGVLRSRSFCTNGVLQDPELGVAACESYYSDGSLKSRDYYKKDKLNNPDSQTPASVEYHDNGTLAAVTYRVEGSRVDLTNGTPGTINYDCYGNVIRGYSSRKGEMIGADEVIQMVERGRAEKLNTLCGAETEVITTPLIGISNSRANPAHNKGVTI